VSKSRLIVWRRQQLRASVSACMHRAVLGTLRSSFAGSTLLLDCAVPPAYSRFKRPVIVARENRLYLTYEEQGGRPQGAENAPRPLSHSTCLKLTSNRCQR